MENVFIAGLIVYSVLATWYCIQQASDLNESLDIRELLSAERDHYRQRYVQSMKESQAYEAENKKLHERLRKLACIARFKE